MGISSEAKIRKMNPMKLTIAPYLARTSILLESKRLSCRVIGKVEARHTLRIVFAAAMLLALHVHANTNFIGGLIILASNQFYSNPVVLTNDTTILSATGSNITFGSTVDGAYNLAISTPGITTFDAAVGGNASLNSLIVYPASGTTFLNTSVITSGSQTYGRPVILGGPATLTSLTAGIAFSSSVDGAQSLTLNAPGTSSFGGLVGGTTALTSLTVGGGGTVNIASNLVTTTGSQNYDENVDLKNPGETGPINITLTSLGGANITFGGTINVNGPSDVGLTVNTSGNTTFNGIIGGNAELYSLATSPAGSVTINTTSIGTFADQIYGNVTLKNSVDMSSSGARGNISFGTIDGAYNLFVINARGTNTFNGVVGSVTPLSALDVVAGAVELNAASVTTSVYQFYNMNVLLETNVCLTNTGFGSFGFGGTVDGAQNLTVMSRGDAFFDGSVGSLTPLSGLTVGGGGSIYLHGSVTTTGLQSYNDNVRISAPMTCESLGGGSITFADNLDGTNTFTMSTSGAATLNGPVVLAAFTATGGGSLAINGGLVNTTGAQTYDEPATLGEDTTLSGSPLSLPTLAGNNHVLTLSNSLVNALGGLNNDLAQLVIAGGGSVELDATFSVPSVNVTAPATLTGSGVIIAPVTVQPGATLAPNLSAGPFTLLDSLSLSGTTVMELNPGVPTNDLARTFGNIAYGGQLTVTNLGGTLAAGNSFRLFEGGSYTGAFTNLNLPPLPAGLTWDTRALTNDGSLLVGILPVLNSIAMTGPGDFQLTATGMPNELYNVLATTNVALPVAQWWMIGSATADPSGTINFTDTTATNGSRFYRLGQ